MKPFVLSVGGGLAKVGGAAAVAAARGLQGGSFQALAQGLPSSQLNTASAAATRCRT